ncbi:MAG TPA: alpha/beta hydrolase [Burkholderiaceae bacterium]|nr:alpha/beta hydrolase [Burkholderiaceae bacterium]
MRTTPKPSPAAVPDLARRSGLLAILATLLSGCSAAGVLDSLVAHDTYRGEQGLPYGPDPRQRVDIFRPLQAAPSGTAGYPVVVFFYGGAWTRGNRADYRFVGEALAAHGAIAVLADYRLSPQVRYPEFLQDSALAVRWVFDQATALGGDGAQIFLMGHSAGAYNAAMLALDPRWLRAVQLEPARLAGWIGIAGPYDFLPIRNPDAQVAFNWPDTSPETQPIAHASAKAPRALLLGASTDDLVNPQRNTVGLAQRLTALGASATVQLFGGVSHTTILASMARPLNWLAPVLPEVLGFLGLPRQSS